MTITKKFVENLGSMYGKKPCSDGMNWYIENFKAPVEHTEVFEKAISDGVVKYATWASL